MKIIQYNTEYNRDVHCLWNSSGVKQGFVYADEQHFEKLILGHRYFSENHAFVLIEDKKVLGFICGCTGEDLPKGDERGYFTCLLLSEEADTNDNASMLLNALEDSFRKAGKKSSACTFFNPMRLPWVIPDTPGHQHNNAPGIAIELPLYDRMTCHGYAELARECAMYLNLKEFTLPDWLEEKQINAAKQGYSIDWYDKQLHTGLKNMVDSMGNAQWSTEIPAAAENINMIVALKDNEVVGFTGPVYPEETGRGYFAGIAVSSHHEKRGLGTLLFYRLCLEEKRAGAEYMSLFTGVDNHAGAIYRNAGFKDKRIFSVMIKTLKS